MNEVDNNYMITQQESIDMQGKNFYCPVCGIKRIVKAKIYPNEDNHTGCKCTHLWLAAHGEYIKPGRINTKK